MEEGPYAKYNNSRTEETIDATPTHVLNSKEISCRSRQ